MIVPVSRSHPPRPRVPHPRPPKLLTVGDAVASFWTMLTTALQGSRFPGQEEPDLLRRLLAAAAGGAVFLGVVISGLAIVPRSNAQSNSISEPRVEFEVASVRASDPKRGSAGSKTGRAGGGGSGPPDVEHRRFSATNLNLFALIVRAYGIRACRPLGGGQCALLAGGPAWLRTDGFDIRAKMPDNSPDYTSIQLLGGHAPQLQLAIQSLLADRFRLKVHLERRQAEIYELTIGRKGYKLKKADESEGPMLGFRPSFQPNGVSTIQWVVRNQSLQDLSETLSQVLERPVLDRSGLKGNFDFTMEYDANTDDAVPNCSLRSKNRSV
jgi:uncharacterized protein (TIGR03435 family)